MTQPYRQVHEGVVTSRTARTVIGVLLLAAAVFLVCASVFAQFWVVAGLGIAVIAVGVAGYVAAAPNIRLVPGVPGSAEVIGIPPRPSTGAVNERCELILTVHAPGMDGVTVRIKETVPMAKWPRVGATLPILVAVDDPGNVRVRWDLVERKPGPRPRRTRIGEQSGTVRWFNAEAGFGYIEPSDGGPEVFVHRSSVVGNDRRLRSAEHVWFDMYEDTEGRRSAGSVWRMSG